MTHKVFIFDSMMQKNVLFITDPIDSLEPGHDTSLGLMEAAIKHGDRVFVTTPKDFVINSDSHVGNIYAAVREVTSFAQQQHPTENKRVSAPVTNGTVVNMTLNYPPGSSAGKNSIAAPVAVLQRQDDRSDWSTQQIATRLHPKICVLNGGEATLSTEDKIAIVTDFPDLCPPSMITADADKLIGFAEHMKYEGDQKLVLKATQSYGGNDVKIIQLTDVNWQQQIRDYTQEKNATKRPMIVAQKFLSDVKNGDMRIFYINGKPIAAVNRVPSHEETLANMAQGGIGIAVPLRNISPTTMAAVHQVVDWGKRQGIVIVGVDVIGQDRPYITELNPGSPTGLIEAQEQLGQDVCSEAWVAVKEAIHEHQIAHGNLLSLHWQFISELFQHPGSYLANVAALAQRWLITRFS
ncbi:hypothetical protein [Adonisia turfae]|uniref:ATP-grasp domain-containing protein n=1 Tax=Adonisia turfae CCMR0081 TaxID=2292702 RepID=A0A6M0RKN2_9CYAN|nr:hypothetical protein [Adonisia turfae]NEZ56353.1 hypothetical protein [Adonisia turfae CCMR0081]